MFTVPDPIRIAEGTYLIRPLAALPGMPFALHVNSLVIQGAEPVIVDTGAAPFRDDWAEQVFGLVDPQDVRWIFLSHDGVDHTGNVALALDTCPRATVVTTPLVDLRVGSDPGVAPDRRRWITDGEALALPDRRLVALRPPTFDSPTTLGLYDSATGVYWSSDAFGTPVPDAVDCVADLPASWWLEASTTYSSLLSPWHTVVDPLEFGRWVDRIAELRPTAIVGAHGPAILGSSVDAALDAMRRLPCVPAVTAGPRLVDRLTSLLRL